MTFVEFQAPLVVDASVAVEWVLGTERWASEFGSWIANDRVLVAPAHFMAEVANSQLRGRGVPVAQITMRIDQLYGAGIELTETNRRRLVEALHLAERHSLTVYDALYLQLAIDIDGELATLDKELLRAAATEDVTVVGAE